MLGGVGRRGSEANGCRRRGRRGRGGGRRRGLRQALAAVTTEFVRRRVRGL